MVLNNRQLRKQFVERLKKSKNPKDCLVVDAGTNMFNTNPRCVLFKDDIKKVPNGAFANCFKLDLIVLSNSIKNIGQGAFAHHKCPFIYVPNSVNLIGQNAFYNKKMQAIRLPRHKHFEMFAKDFSYLDIFIYDNEIICTHSNETKQKDLLQEGCYKSDVYLECNQIDYYDLWNGLSTINSLHIGSHDTLIATDVPFTPKIIDHIYMNNVGHSKLLFDGGCLVDLTSGKLLFVENRENIVLPSSITDLNSLPDCQKGKTINYDISQNNHFIKRNDIIINSKGKALFVPNQTTVYFINCTSFARNIFENKTKITKIIIAPFEVEQIDLCSLFDALNNYCVNRFTIVFPTKLYGNTIVNEMFLSFGNKIVYKDYEESDYFLE